MRSDQRHDGESHNNLYVIPRIAPGGEDSSDLYVISRRARIQDIGESHSKLYEIL